MIDAAPEHVMPPELGFLQGGGRATRLILARDWTDHPLGGPSGWPIGLKNALGLVLNSPESMILCWGEQDLHFFFNETYCPLLGPRVDWAMGAPFNEVWADAWEQAKPIIDDAFAGRSMRFNDLPWKLDTDRGAADTWWSFSYSRVLDERGGIAGLFIFTNETTARVLADRALAASQAALTALNETLERQVEERTAERDRMWNTSPDLMVALSPEGIYRRINPAWQTVLGYDPADVIGAYATDFTHPDDLAATQAAFETAQAGTLPNFENRFRHKDGSYRWIQWVAAPGPDEVFAIGRHVTDAKTAEARLRETEAQLRQAQKMEAVGQLTGGIAHDFNNMLTGVIGSLDLLGRRLGMQSDPRVTRYIEAATTSAQRAAGLTQRLLAFSRRQPLDVRATDVNMLATGLEDLLARTIGENVALELALSDATWPALTDHNQLESALLNLAINARDAMSGQGKLTIELANAHLDDDYARLHDEVEPGQYVMLAVSDTGTGMSPEIIDKVFEPFFSTKSEGKGSGLGLSMVYGFVKQSGGHVKIYSEVGEGTTIKLYLPRSAQSEDVEVVTDIGPAIGGTETVLVVEDDDEVRATVVEMLGDLGYRVLKAVDAQSALNVIESGIPIDILFTDVVMPGTLKSPELARKAKERLPDLAVLFTSGYTENSIVHGGRLDAGVELLSKPYTREALARKFRHVLANQRQRTQSLEARALASPPAPLRPQPAGRGQVTVLLVEDDEVIRGTTAELLQQGGYVVVDAASAEDAMTALQTVPIDVLVTDVNLPGISGPEFATRARALRSGIGIVFATGDVGAVPAETGAVLLAKPYGLETLQAAIAGAIGRPAEAAATPVREARDAPRLEREAD